MSKDILKFGDLKFYHLLEKFIAANNNNYLANKLSVLSIEPPQFKEPLIKDSRYWYPIKALLYNSAPWQSFYFLNYEYKKDWILFVDKVFQDISFHYSSFNWTVESLLLDLLRGLLVLCGCSLTMISDINKVYPELNLEFGLLEYNYIDFWFDLLPAIDEIVCLLKDINSAFVFRNNREFNFELASTFAPTMFGDPFYVYIVERPEVAKDRNQAYLEFLCLSYDKQALMFADRIANISDNSFFVILSSYIKNKGVPASKTVGSFLYDHFISLSPYTLSLIVVNFYYTFDSLREFISKQSYTLSEN